MFYSRQLLARKAPLGQIWMAATTHLKMNRRKLDELDIIRICEEILNPSVPMALRLSGILMGGVVIVYERKVKLFYDDVNRLLVEISNAWKVKASSDSSIVPKRKSKAKHVAGNLAETLEEEVIEQSVLYSSAETMMGFTKTTYSAMRLDKFDVSDINQNQQEDLPLDHHQADPVDITLFEPSDPYQADASMYNRFERFDIEGDEDTQLNFTVQENISIPSTLVPSPHPQEKPNERKHKGNASADEIFEQRNEDQVNRESDQGNKAFQDQIRQGPNRRRARRPAALQLDYEQTIIPGHIYQSWLQNTSDLRKKRNRVDFKFKGKISNLMELPSVILNEGLFRNGTREVHYPAPLLELWRSHQPQRDSPSGESSAPQPPEASSSSPPKRTNGQDPLGYPSEHFQNGIGSLPKGVPAVELLRHSSLLENYIPSQIQEITTTSKNVQVPPPETNGFSFIKTNSLTPQGNSGDEILSIPSSGSGYSLPPHNSEGSRSGTKRPHSSSRHGANGLETVAEDNAWENPDPMFKLAKLSGNNLAPENELLIETGPTQTQQHPTVTEPINQITQSIRMQLKAHFDTSGSSKAESLDQLTFGMNKKSAACLFYQTCVLATQECVRVEQKEPYGDILISRGAKM